MKKKMSILLAVLISVFLVTGVAAVSVPFEDSTMLQTFEASFQSEIDAGWGGAFGTWGGGIAFTNHTIEGGKLKTTYPASSENPVWMVYVDNPVATDIGIGFWIDASAISTEFSLRIFLGDNENFSENKIGETIYLVPDSGTPTTSEVVGDDRGEFAVPAGFVGSIMINIDSFDHKDGFSPNDFRISETPSFRVMMRTIFTEPTVVYYDNVKYLAAAGDETGTATPTTAPTQVPTDDNGTTPSDNSNILYTGVALLISSLAGLIVIKKRVFSAR